MPGVAMRHRRRYTTPVPRARAGGLGGGEVRVIAGSARGRRLKSGSAPRNRGAGLRPTADRVRESLFSILEAGRLGAGPLSGSAFLDLYAGTGSVGIEALSRGAARATFVESDRARCRLIAENLALTGLAAAAAVVCAPVARALPTLERRGSRCGFIFIDPPYEGGLAADTLNMIGRTGLLVAGGVVVVEHSRRAALPEAAGGLSRIRRESYGDTVLSFYVSVGGTGMEGRYGEGDP